MSLSRPSRLLFLCLLVVSLLAGSLNAQALAAAPRQVTPEPPTASPETGLADPEATPAPILTPDIPADLPPDQKAALLLQSLTPEERVGQLFLVTFKGGEASGDSQINELVSKYFVGGVVLLRSNDNFGPSGQTASQALALNIQLQRNRYNGSLAARLIPATGQYFNPAFIPLFIGISQEGNGAPNDQILNGLTPLPNLMSLGATWDVKIANQVGTVLGRELSILGFNLLLGPSLDVLETPNSQGANDLGARTFGGDPFWVGKLGQAYIEGLHVGSENRMAIAAKHFPGHGGSDRLPEEEVATVPKSLEQLKNFELYPFFSVTGNAPSPEATVDALLASHIRFQGFQGNIRATTRPVTFDAQAFKQLMGLPALDSWRQRGGVVISDNLGSPAVRGYYQLTGQDFDMPRRVALNAFLAGNDLLYVADFSSGDQDSYTSAVQTLNFFAQKYREDPAFAQRVDESVQRILTLKFKIYPEFTLSKVSPSSEEFGVLGQSSAVTFTTARQAATLISPTQQELDNALPDPPGLTDRIVFITDERKVRQCSNCQPQNLIGVEDLQKVVLRRYGPGASRQVSPDHLISYSLKDLDDYLNGPVPGDDPAKIEANLRRATWIVFAMLDASSQFPSYNTLSRFLAERPNLIQGKRLVVFAFDAPYYLDATNISKLSAMYGLYSHTPQFVDVAGYLLFREYVPNGASPVSIPGVSYDLTTALFPSPDQIIPLSLDLPPPSPTGTVSVAPEFVMGSMIPLRAGAILDTNGHIVPDGTPVNFILTYGSDASSVRQTEVTTGGVARSFFTINNSGPVEIRAEVELPSLSEPARSITLRFDIPSPNETPIPQATLTATASPTPTATPTLTPTPEAPALVVEEPPPPPRPELADWIMAVLVIAFIAWGVYRLAALIGQVRWGVRAGFLALIGGLAAYSYLALHLPGADGWMAASVSRAVLVVSLGGALAGLLATWSWRSVSENGMRKKKTAEE